MYDKWYSVQLVRIEKRNKQIFQYHISVVDETRNLFT